MWSEKIPVGPERAQELLEMNSPETNRRVDWTTVSHYSRMMKSGEWREDINPIMVTKNKKLANGQHTLLAIVESGCKIKLEIKWDMPEDTIFYVDKNRVRSLGDTIHLMGMESAYNMAPMVKNYLQLKKDKPFSGSGLKSVQLTEDMIRDEINIDKEYWHSVVKIAQSYYRAINHYLAIPFIGAWYVRLCDIDQDDAQEFFEKLCRNEGVFRKKDSIKLLRNKLEANYVSKKSKLNLTYISAIFIKAWNSFRMKKDMSVLDWNSEREHYPKPI
jgi:hypothetical protein